MAAPPLQKHRQAIDRARADIEKGAPACDQSSRKSIPRFWPRWRRELPP
jgi:hypothetical protein